MLLVSSSFVLGCLQGGCASEAAQTETQPPAPAEPLSASLPQQSAQELDQLVAPIALYPDALVAQILAAGDLSYGNRGGGPVGCSNIPDLKGMLSLQPPVRLHDFRRIGRGRQDLRHQRIWVQCDRATN